METQNQQNLEVNRSSTEKMDQEEYQRRLVGIYSRVAASQDQAVKQRLQREMFDLRLDFKLGADFPQTKKDTLWQIQQNLDQKVEWDLFKGLLFRPWDPAFLMAKKRIRGFSEILDGEQMEALLDLSREELAKFE